MKKPMGWFLDIELVNGAIGITLFSIFSLAISASYSSVAVSVGIWKLATYTSLEWRDE
tara:strand:- start:1202 stop:1375 length:174 start_codon:yes stop_codon:yes gene_type:complete